MSLLRVFLSLMVFNLGSGTFLCVVYMGVAELA